MSRVGREWHEAHGLPRLMVGNHTETRNAAGEAIPWHYAAAGGELVVESVTIRHVEGEGIKYEIVGTVRR